MNKEVERYLKKILKKRVKITASVLVSFLLTGVAIHGEEIDYNNFYTYIYRLRKVNQNNFFLGMIEGLKKPDCDLNFYKVKGIKLPECLEEPIYEKIDYFGFDWLSRPISSSIKEGLGVNFENITIETEGDEEDSSENNEVEENQDNEDNEIVEDEEGQGNEEEEEENNDGDDEEDNNGDDEEEEEENEEDNFAVVESDGIIYLTEEENIGQDYTNDTKVYNRGSILTATGESIEIGIGQRVVGNGLLYNYGTIDAVAGKSYGQYISGTGRAYNYGDIDGNSFNLNGSNLSYGQYATSGGAIYNEGNIRNETLTEDENGISYGQYVDESSSTGSNSSLIANSTIYSGISSSIEVYSYGQYSKEGSIVNTGTIRNTVLNNSSNEITAYIGGQHTDGGEATNSGDINLSYTTTDDAIYLRGQSVINNGILINGGDMELVGSSSNGVSRIFGQESIFGDNELSNEGTITIDNDGNSMSISYGQSGADNGDIENSGTINIDSNSAGGLSTSYGQAGSSIGNVENSGAINITNSAITSATAYGQIGNDNDLTNSGTIIVENSSTFGSASVRGQTSNLDIENSGSLILENIGDSSTTAYAQTSSGTGDITNSNILTIINESISGSSKSYGQQGGTSGILTNSGEFRITNTSRTSSADIYGQEGATNGNIINTSNITLMNTGALDSSVYGQLGKASGNLNSSGTIDIGNSVSNGDAYLYIQKGSTTGDVTNEGTNEFVNTTTNGNANTYGQIIYTGTGTNTGTILGLTNSSGGAIESIMQLVDSGGSGNLINTGSLDSGGTATNGSASFHGQLIRGDGNTTNSGTIEIVGTSNGEGMVSSGQQVTGTGLLGNTGLIYLQNGGTLSTASTAYGQIVSSGSITQSGGDIEIGNTSGNGNATALGQYIENNGTITSTGTSSSILVVNEATGGRAESYGQRIGGDGDITNEGTIDLTTISNDSYAITLGQRGDGNLTNSGTILIDNTGSIYAQACAQYGSDSGTLVNSGTITIENESDTGYAQVYAQYGSDTGDITNSGDITITNSEIGTGSYAQAYGQYGRTLGDVISTTDASITIINTAASNYASVYGQYGSEGGDVTNRGEIAITNTASADDSRTSGQRLRSLGALSNTGTINLVSSSITEENRSYLQYASETGGGIILTNTGTMASTNSAISGDISSYGQYILNDGDINNTTPGSLTLVNVVTGGSVETYGQKIENRGDLTNNGNITIETHSNYSLGAEVITGSSIAYGQYTTSGSAINTGRISFEKYVDFSLEDGSDLTHTNEFYGQYVVTGEAINSGTIIVSRISNGVEVSSGGGSTPTLSSISVAVGQKGGENVDLTNSGTLYISSKSQGFDEITGFGVVLNSEDSESRAYGQDIYDGGTGINSTGGAIKVTSSIVNPTTSSVIEAVGQRATKGATAKNYGTIYVNEDNEGQSNNSYNLKDIGILATTVEGTGTSSGAIGINYGTIKVWNDGETGTLNLGVVEGIAVGMVANGTGAVVINEVGAEIRIDGATENVTITSGGSVDAAAMQELNGGKAYNYGTITIDSSMVGGGVGGGGCGCGNLSLLSLDNHKASTSAKYRAPKVNIGSNFKIMPQEAKGDVYRIDDFISAPEGVSGVENIVGLNKLYTVLANDDGSGNIDLVVTRDKSITMGDELSDRAKKIESSLNITENVIDSNSYINTADSIVSQTLMRAYNEDKLENLILNDINSNIYTNLSSKSLEITDELTSLNSSILFNDKNRLNSEIRKDGEFINEGIFPTILKVNDLDLGIGIKSSNSDSDETKDGRVAYNRESNLIGVGLSKREKESKKGLTLSYSYSDIDFDKDKGKGNNSSLNLLYGEDKKVNDSDLSYYIGGSVIWHEYERTATLENISRKVESDFNSYVVSTGIELGKEFKFDKLTLKPTVRVDADYIYREGFSEKGGNSLDMVFDKSHIYSLKSKVSLEGEYELYKNGNHEFILNANIVYDYELGNITTENEKVKLRGLNGYYYLEEARDDNYELNSELGLKYRFKENLEVSSSYKMRNSSSDEVKFGVKYSW